MEPSAQAAMDAVQRRPREAIAIGRKVLQARARSGHNEAGQDSADERSTAQRAIGLALRELNDFPAALRHLRRAVWTADRAGSPRVAALARMSLGYVLANTGRNIAALRAVSAALTELTGADAGHARLQRGVVLHYCGRYDEAVRDYGMAIAIAQQEGDPLLEARARNNRGLIQANLGAAGAGPDLDRASAIFTGLGLDLAAADVRWNSGIASAQRGDIPLALRTFAQTEAQYRRLDVPRPALLLDRLELLLSIPLVAEANTLATATVRELRHRGMASDLAEALLVQARVALLDGDPQTAATAAAAALERFRRQRRPVWAAFARHVALRAEVHQGVRSASLLASLIRTADVLDGVGWQAPATTLRIAAAGVAADLDRPDQARAQLLVASQGRRGGTAARRAQGWYAQARLRRLAGDDRGASIAARRGLAVLDTYRASLGATELRAHSGSQGRELAEEGLDIAVRQEAPGQVLAWAESWRAGALRMAPILPPPDPALAAALGELRAVSADLEQALLAGRADDRLRVRQIHLEQRIRDLVRTAEDLSPNGGASGHAPPSLRRLAGRLGDSVLVEFVAHRERLLAVVVRDGRATLHRLGALDDARRQLRLLCFGLRRVVTLPDPAPAGKHARRAANLLDDQLFAPLRPRIADRPLVVVPVGELHAVPWSALPSCAQRPITVAPSAAAWLRAGSAGPADLSGPVVLAAGPRLPAATAEVTALAAAFPQAHVLVEEKATAAAVAEALDGARLAHLAAHGAFRADNPLFSTIEFADGSLTVYELERLRHTPDCVVLSACEVGLSTVHPGDELMGFTAALLALGTRTLIASLLPVPAETTSALMLDLHGRMRAGERPASALAAAQRAHVVGGDAVGGVTAAAFVCFGAG
jgi:tetratricopeptide (TPR) repeat protein